jgi:uncharacterized metal-binding protein YceD (DUF177 family)
MTPEFSRPQRIDTIGEGVRAIGIEADAGERAALAQRFDLLSVDTLRARFDVRREAGGIVATGRVEAAVVQACSITDEPLPARIDEAVALRFVEPGGSEEEIELSNDLLDTVEIEGGAVDLGEAAAETMALALDPFPRSPRAAEVLRAAGVLTEEEARPEGPLAALKAKFEGR